MGFGHSLKDVSASSLWSWVLAPEEVRFVVPQICECVVLGGTGKLPLQRELSWVRPVESQES